VLLHTNSDAICHQGGQVNLQVFSSGVYRHRDWPAHARFGCMQCIETGEATPTLHDPQSGSRSSGHPDLAASSMIMSVAGRKASFAEKILPLFFVRARNFWSEGLGREARKGSDSLFSVAAMPVQARHPCRRPEISLVEPPPRSPHTAGHGPHSVGEHSAPTLSVNSRESQ
jgi:hypothetical protein